MTALLAFNAWVSAGIYDNPALAMLALIGWVLALCIAIDRAYPLAPDDKRGWSDAQIAEWEVLQRHRHDGGADR